MENDLCDVCGNASGHILECKHKICESCLANSVGGGHGTEFIICSICNNVTDLKPADGFENHAFVSLSKVQKLRDHVNIMDEFVPLAENRDDESVDSSISISLSDSSEEKEEEDQHTNPRNKLKSSSSSFISFLSSSMSPSASNKAETKSEYQLLVRLVRAEGLATAQLGDVAVVQLLTGHTRKWSAVTSSNEAYISNGTAKWNETYILNVRNPVADFIRVQLHFHQAGRAKLCGKGNFLCSQIPNGEEMQVFVPFYNTRRRKEIGGIYLGLRAIGFGLPMEAIVVSLRRNTSRIARRSQEYKGYQNIDTSNHSAQAQPEPGRVPWLNGSILDNGTPPVQQIEGAPLVSTGKQFIATSGYIHAFWGPVYSLIFPMLILRLIDPGQFTGRKMLLFYLFVLLWVPALALAPILGCIADIFLIVLWPLTCGCLRGRHDIRYENDCDFHFAAS